MCSVTSDDARRLNYAASKRQPPTLRTHRSKAKQRRGGKTSAGKQSEAEGSKSEGKARKGKDEQQRRRGAYSLSSTHIHPTRPPIHPSIHPFLPSSTMWVEMSLLDIALCMGEIMHVDFH